VKSSLPLDFTHDKIYADYFKDAYKRFAIVSAYQSIGSPHESLWKDDVLKQLSNLLKPIYGYTHPDVITRVLNNFINCVDESVIYEGNDKEGRGRHVNLSLNSTEGQYAIDLIEKGYSYAMATEILNRM
jgi:hypothetical protein